jgi:hypothetical protein
VGKRINAARGCEVNYLISGAHPCLTDARAWSSYPGAELAVVVVAVGRGRSSRHPAQLQATSCTPAYVTKPVDLDQFISAVRQIGEFFLQVVKLPGV